MNNFTSVLLIVLLLFVVSFLSWYVSQALRTVLGSWDTGWGNALVHGVYWAMIIAYLGYIILSFSSMFRDGLDSSKIQFMFNVVLTVSITQVTIILFLFGEDIYRGVQGGINYFTASASSDKAYIPERRKFVSQVALVAAALPLASFVYGMTKGKYNFRVLRETLYFKDLPDAFDGFTITQISDIHAGSFRDFEAVQKGINLAKEQKSDLFVFTGDLVNRTADEMDPLLDRFKEIEAPYGQYSILGNHDYGDYTTWRNGEDKERNFEELKAQHAKMGYKLLLDEHVTINKDGQKIQLLGVENWGVGFKSKGNLENALKDVENNDFKVLLSHDPSHWEMVVKDHPSKIHLTLSGHTHGMQFGVETPVIRWSPAKYRYPNWAGLAEQAGRYLYVNRGFGFHAFDGRVGIWPEITVIELRKQA